MACHKYDNQPRTLIHESRIVNQDSWNTLRVGAEFFSLRCFVCVCCRKKYGNFHKSLDS